ncbi:hypothetical protein FWF89_01395 [Candidatus Saccharibacteria bacterium]|nr:hypothetical protein [Candidatus Saccharibacteria bacterium]
MKKKKEAKKIWLLIVIVVVVIAGAAAGILIWRGNDDSNGGDEVQELVIEMQDVAFRQNGVDVEAKIPKEGWFEEEKMYIFNFFNPDKDQNLDGVIDLDDVRIGTPRVSITIASTREKFDVGIFADNIAKATPVAGRTIGGLEMTGREWSEASNGTFIEYIGKIDEKHFVGVSVNNLDVENAEAKAILNSIEFVNVAY